MKLKAFLTLLLLVFLPPSHAAKWICSVDSAEYSAADTDFAPGTGVGALMPAAKKAGGNAHVKSKVKIDRLDIMQLYTGTPVIVGSTWLKGFVRSPNAQESTTAFLEIGLDPNTSVVAEKLARASNYSDKGLRYVNTEQEVILGVATRSPSVGYVTNYVGGVPGVKDCFSN